MNIPKVRKVPKSCGICGMYMGHNDARARVFHLACAAHSLRKVPGSWVVDKLNHSHTPPPRHATYMQNFNAYWKRIDDWDNQLLKNIERMESMVDIYHRSSRI
jgi:hypothetical protein